MKQVSILFSMLAMVTFHCYSQEDSPKVFYNGLYVAKTGSVPAANLEIFTYFLFYEDGSVYLQSVSSNDPQAVLKWFGRDKKFSQKGTYSISGSTITIRLTNKDSKDLKLEGPVETKYTGSIKQGNQLCLIRNEEKNENCFSFSKSL